MTVTTTGARHRAACRPTTPLSVLGPTARRGMFVAASSGLALTMAASTAIAAPESATSALPQVDVSALSSQARGALAVSPTVSVPTDIEFQVEEVAAEAIAPKTTTAEDSDPIAEHLAAEAARREAEARAEAEAAALAEQRAAEAASRSRSSAPAATAATSGNSSAAAQTTAAPAPAQAATGNAILDVAFRYVGTPYVWGGASPSGFDCSGFTWYVFQQLGIDIPRSSSAQRNAGTVVSASEARPGDLVWWPGHVGIYTGDGNHIAARNPSKPLQAGPLSHVGRGTPTFIRVG